MRSDEMASHSFAELSPEPPREKPTGPGLVLWNAHPGLDKLRPQAPMGS